MPTRLRTQPQPTDNDRLRDLETQRQNSLVQRVQAGDAAAREELIERCLPLLTRLARSCATPQVAADELISEGALSLIRATESFDHRKGVPFAAYAAVAIRHDMRRAVRSAARTIRVPGHEQARLARIAAASQTIQTRTGRKPTPHELAEATGLPVSEIVTRLERRGGYSISLSAGENPVEAELPALTTGAVRTLELKDESDLQAGRLRDLLRSLGVADRDLIRRRFGLDGRPAATISDLARDAGVTPRIIRTTLDRILSRLRTLSAAA